MAAQKEFEAARKRDEINRSLQRRIDRDTLVTRNVIKDDHMAASQRNQLNALRRSMLEDKLKKVRAGPSWSTCTSTLTLLSI